MSLASMFASSDPVHRRGPRSYGRQALSGMLCCPSHRSGTKSSLVSPKMAGSRWMSFAIGARVMPSTRNFFPSGIVSVVPEPLGAILAVPPGGYKRKISLTIASVSASSVLSHESCHQRPWWPRCMDRHSQGRRVISFSPPAVKSFSLTADGCGSGPNTSSSSSRRASRERGHRRSS